MITGKASRFRHLLTVGAFFIALTGQPAVYDFNENCRLAYREILCLRFGEAHRLLQTEKRRQPDNLVPLYLENSIDFLTLVIGEERSQYQRLKSNKQSRINALGQGSENSPYFRFLMAEVHLQWAVARLKFQDYTAAAWEIRKAYALYEENAARFPGFIANRAGFGVVRVVVSLVPDEYRWITSLIGMEGSLEEGLKDIRAVAEYSGPDPVARMYRPQASFFLAFLILNLQKSKEAALDIPAIRPAMLAGEPSLHSPLLIYARATVLMRNGRNDEALEVLRERHTIEHAYPFRFLDYLEGTALLNRLDPGAAACFEQFITGFRGVSYLRSARQKMAWAALIRGDSAGYFRLMEQVRQTGASEVDEDKQAGYEAASGVLPNLRLLRSRLLFDGGYYDRALAELLEKPLTQSLQSRRDLLEYTYRLARIYHEKGNLLRALAGYRQAAVLGRNEPWYFAAAAAYQAGLLYENAGDRVRADSAYHACLSMKPAEYRTSLHQKARTGIGRLTRRPG